jgi:hypothetical protein
LFANLLRQCLALKFVGQLVQFIEIDASLKPECVGTCHNHLLGGHHVLSQEAAAQRGIDQLLIRDASALAFAFQNRSEIIIDSQRRPHAMTVMLDGLMSRHLLIK